MNKTQFEEFKTELAKLVAKYEAYEVCIISPNTHRLYDDLYDDDDHLSVKHRLSDHFSKYNK